MNGSVNAAYANSQAFCAIYYDETLQVPTLNVILLQLSWKETTPSAGDVDSLEKRFFKRLGGTLAAARFASSWRAMSRRPFILFDFLFAGG